MDDKRKTKSELIRELRSLRRKIRKFESVEQERKPAEEALRESEERFRKVFEEGPIGMVLTSRDLRFFSANPAFCQMLGYTAEEMSRRTFLDLTHPDHRHADRENVENMWQGKIPHYRTEKRYIAKNGNIRWGNLSTSLIKGRDGKPIYALAMVEDITERKRAEEGLRESEEKLRVLFEQLPIGVSLLDQNRKMIYANPALEKILDISRDDLLQGKHQNRRYIRPDGTPMPPEEYASVRAFQEQQPVRDVEIGVITESAKTIWTSVSAAPFPVADKGVVVATVDITERKGMEEALRQTETHLRTVLSNAPITIFAIDNEGLFTLSEGKGLDRVGLKPAENVGGSALDLYGGTSFVEYNGRVTTGKDVIERVFSGRSVNAINELHGVSFDNHIGPIRDAEGKVVGIVGVATDITDRKQAEDALRESEERYRSLVEAAPDVVYTISAEDGSLTSLNRAFETITGWSRAEWLGKHFTEIVHSDDRTAAVETFQKVLRGEAPPLYQLRILSKSGEYLVGEFTSTPQVKGGKVVGELGIARDITERKRAEEALALLAHSVRSISECVSITDAENKILFVNDAFLRTYGYSEEELIGKSIALVRSPAARPAVDNVLNATLQGGWQGELLNRKKDGTEFPISLSTSIIRGHDGRPLGLVGIAADITERVRAEEALRRSDETFRNLFNNSEVGMFRTRLDGSEVLDANEKFLEIFGRTREEVIGNPSMVHWADPREREEMVRRLKAEGRVVDFECKMLNKKGHVRDCLASLNLHPEEGILEGSVVDITERKQAEQALRLSERKYRDLVGNALVGVYQSTISGDILFANDALIRMFEYANFGEFARGKAQGLYRDPRDRERFITLLKQSGRVTAFESEVLTKNGAVKTVLTSATLSDDLLSGIIRDITEPKKSEVALRAAQSRLQRLSRRLLEVQENERRWLARELHDEIGQILTAAKIDLQVIRRTPVSDDLAVRLDDNIAMLDRCLHQVRNLSLDLRPSMLDDLGLVAALRWQLERQAERVGFQARLIAEDLPERFDPDLETTCFRIAQEALTNISRHAEANNVEIEVRICKPELLLTIRDDGVGFDVDRALADSTHGKSFGILGMQERVALLDGKLAINSEDKRGTIVTVRLPLQLAEKREH
jgi:PAS domain S-box-containing protein